MYRMYFKRMLDILLSLAALILLSPLLLILYILVRINFGKPAIFKHERPGKDEKIFTLYKFRSMTDDRDVEGNLLPDNFRLTKFGRKLRATSLDELPELFNILNGDMSIVGPRPLVVYYLPYYTEKEKHRHDVHPGLTGLAQVNGRNSLSWEKRFEYDLEYLKDISFAKDVKIVFQTVAAVLKRKGVGTAEEAFNEYRINQMRISETSKGTASE